MQVLLSLLSKKLKCVRTTATLASLWKLLVVALSPVFRQWDQRAGEDFDTALKYRDPSVHILQGALQTTSAKSCGGESSHIYWDINAFYETVDPSELREAIDAEQVHGTTGQSDTLDTTIRRGLEVHMVQEAAEAIESYERARRAEACRRGKISDDPQIAYLVPVEELEGEMLCQRMMAGESEYPIEEKSDEDAGCEVH